MQAAIRSFLNHLRTNRRMMPNTVRAYDADLAEYARFLGGCGIHGPAQVDRDACARFLDSSEAAGRAASTRRRRVAAVRGFHAYARATGLSLENPAEDLRGPARRERLPRVLTEAQVVALLAAADPSRPHGARDRAAIELAYSSALRVSELLSIDLRELSLDRGEVRVIGKGSRAAIVNFGAAARSALEHYLALRPSLQPACEALFLAVGGRRYRPRSFTDALDRLSRRAGLPFRVNPHALRHSCATHMLNNGANLVTVQEHLRHRDISSTMIYTHFDRTRIREALGRFHPRG